MALQGLLYAQDYLERGICEEPEWRSQDARTIEQLKRDLIAIFDGFPIDGRPVEGVTERDLIYPILARLGWPDLLVQQQVSKRRRDDVPDALLFASPEDKAAANREKDPARRYRHGLALAEAKRWLRPLDRADAQGTPSSQMLRYLRRAEEASDGRLKWGYLTNGRVWRLYWQGARSRAEEFLELDLPAILGLPGYALDIFAKADPDHWLRVFQLMFSRSSFLAIEGERHSFHDRALKQTRKWEAAVASDLTQQVFETVFPALVRAINAAQTEKFGRSPLTGAELEQVRRAALTLLYRLLFVLYAEDRRLLPATHKGYAAYSMDSLRDSIAEKLDRDEALSERIATIYGTLRGLFAAIDKGDTKLGLPPYNGGLFDPADHALLEHIELPDSVMALAIDTLSRRTEGERKLRINYRDLSVQQLGSLYEGLLEYEIVTDDTGDLVIRPNVFARKGSGSYYTPEELVQLIVNRTVGPLMDEKLQAFDEALAAQAGSRRPKRERLADLLAHDPAAAIVSLRICDPAMGSGHFLVTLVDVLADRVLAAMAEAESKAAAALGDDILYRSPVQERVDAIRTRILERAAHEKWEADERQLDDRHIVRRMILKRCIYGVDKNPMAVELAKVSLWLHTFTVGAPLSFLDHHLRCGDSLFGELVRPVEDFLAARGSLALTAPLRNAQRAAVEMAVVEEMSDADLAEVARSESSFAHVEAATRPLNAFLDFFHGLRWLDRLPRRRGARGRGRRENAVDPVNIILDGALGDPVDLVSQRGAAVLAATLRTAELFPGSQPEQIEQTQSNMATGRADEALGVVERAMSVAARERFMHWQVAFPGVWNNWESAEPVGGFDAVIGNPPWDRLKLQEVEWLTTRKPEIARQQRASDRKRMIDALKKADGPLYRDYLMAADAAESAGRVARDSGYYPQLSGGDVNIYSLFVERALSLLQPRGMVGLLVPSGIAGDLSASRFFGQISSSGRLAALFDFENRKYFFPDVHASFKFCALVMGSSGRKFSTTECGFYLRTAEDIPRTESVFELSSDDFARVNPNTRTAPIFRSRRDAEIVRGIYERLPVLHDHAKGKTWPVRYFRMFDMTNDAGKFRTRAELEEEGVYPVEGGRLRKGSKEYVPLYVGKTINQFDHRAASVLVNAAAVHVAASSDLTTLDQHRNPAFYPTPQYYLSVSDLNWSSPLSWGVGFRDIARATDRRTCIATLLPRTATGNTLPLLLPEETIPLEQCAHMNLRVVANLNSFALDFVVRCKAQATHLNWYMLEQLPVVPTPAYGQKIGTKTIEELLEQELLPLTYTSEDMRSFAEDIGYEGPPFIWDQEDRRHRRARIDAMFFRLYGIGEEDAAYILDTFPIVREQDEAEAGRYRTKELILAYMRAFQAGDTNSRIAV